MHHIRTIKRINQSQQSFLLVSGQRARIGLTRPTWELIDTGCCSRKSADSTKLYLQDNYSRVTAVANVKNKPKSRKNTSLKTRFQQLITQEVFQVFKKNIS
jgi:hypothetical protein